MTRSLPSARSPAATAPARSVLQHRAVPLAETFIEDDAFYGVMQGVVDGLDASVKLKP
ncbi:hypothetical protein FHT03_003880 [Xanthomonas arboricola]|uniref:hypothetical protein n=1 Tax=Xanthomonas cannabis TaxID=1885674 RepID=UPI00161E38CB|nr:hypothetical protein [Xanthomonas cannabis]MBB3803926.1 hypothetical protein [Xanthomonas cannabis]